MVVLGIDASYKSTGWAVVKDNKLIKYDKILHEIGESFGDFLCRFSKQIINIIKKYKVGVVVLEDLNFTSNFTTAKILLRIQGVIICNVKTCCSIDVEIIHNVKWRSILGIKKPNNVKKVIRLISGKNKSKYVVKDKKILINGKKVLNDIKLSTILYVNNNYSLNLDYKDNDISDAIAIATSWFKVNK